MGSHMYGHESKKMVLSPGHTGVTRNCAPLRNIASPSLIFEKYLAPNNRLIAGYSISQPTLVAPSKCENAAICEKVAKCEKNSTLNVKIDAICEQK